MTTRLIWIILVLVTTAASQSLSSGGCLPSGSPTCTVQYSNNSGSIGCSCQGNCTNNLWVHALATVSWYCQYPQQAWASGHALIGDNLVFAQAEIFGPGYPSYEQYSEYQACDGSYGSNGYITGLC